MEKARTVQTQVRSDAGFTLVEALCAIVILVFGLMAISNLILVAATSNSVANQSSAATTLASLQLERLKATPFDDLPDPGAGTTDGDLDLPSAAGEPACDAALFTDYGCADTVEGVGRIIVRWTVTGVDGQSRFIVVRAQGTGALAGPRSRAEFTTFRTCTDQDPAGAACPAP
jgi:type II secretory pathway pseudopilin PulG